MSPQPLLLAAAFLLSSPLAGQVRINEVAPANVNLADEDGKSPDWIELANVGVAEVDLTGWSLSDRRDRPRAFVFGPTVIPPGGYQLIWASGEDRQHFAARETLVARGDAARYLVPVAPVDEAWTESDFDDGAWDTGATGIGYGHGEGAHATAIPEGTVSLFMRQRFRVADLADLRQLVFHLDFDDGFVAYLNGREIARRNLNGRRPAYDKRAPRAEEARLPQGEAPLSYVVEDATGLLRVGENVLAVQVHTTEGATALSAVPYLLAGYSPRRGDARATPPELRVPARYPHADFKISTSGETVYLSDADGTLVDSLVVRNVPAYGSIGRAPSGSTPVYYARPTPAAANGDDGFTERVDAEVALSRAGGRYGEAFAATLSTGDPGAVIRYTLDGREPDAASPRYVEPIPIDSTAVLRARVFGGEGVAPGPIATATYLIDDPHELDVATLVSDPTHLFDFEDGIYSLGSDADELPPYFGSVSWPGREVPMHLGFHPDREAPAAFALDGGARLFGGFSRLFAQRSLAFFARSGYGESSIDYPVFPDRDYSDFTSLVLRNSGNDWQHTFLRDATLTGLLEGSGLDFADHRPVATYINGEYWGLYNLREKLNEEFLAARHGVDPDEVVLLENRGEVIEGSADDYLALLSYVEATDLSSDAAFARVAEEVDLDNLAAYYAAQIYFDNRDWPGNNLKYWRAPGRKWRYILFDTDFGAGMYNPSAASANTLAFALAPDGPSYPNPPWSTLLLRKSLTNESFRHRFVNRVADQLNRRFLPDSAIALLEANAALIAAEIPRAQARWGGERAWAREVDVIREFFRERPAYLRGHLRAQFTLPESEVLAIEIADTTEGAVRVNSLRIDEPSWSGRYYPTVPVRVTASAKTGYAFSHWRHDASLTDSVLLVDLAGDSTLSPVFAPVIVSAVGEPHAASSGLLAVLSIGPNPVSDALQVAFELSAPTDVTLALTDVLGRPVLRRTLPGLSAGGRSVVLPLDRLPAGHYWLTLGDGAGGRETIQVVRR